MTELRPYDLDEPIGRREYEAEYWGNGHARHWDMLPEIVQADWAEKARRIRAAQDVVIEEHVLVTELVDAWIEVISINRFARENGGKAHRRLWTAIDAIAENRGNKP